MIRLLVADLVQSARAWVGLFAVTAAAGVGAGIAVTMIVTAADLPDPTASALGSLAAWVVTTTLLSGVIVIASSATLVVVLRRRQLALWQIVGITPARVFWTVLAQVAIVAVIGGMSGARVGATMTPAYAAWVFADWNEIADVRVTTGMPAALIAGAGVAVLAIIAGLFAAARAARTAPIRILREPEPPVSRFRLLRALVAVAAFAGVCALVLSAGGGELRDVANFAPIVAPMMVVTFVIGGPLLYPTTLRLWTGLMPARAGVAWHLARHAARFRLTQSAAAIGPLTVGISMVGGFTSVAATLGTSPRGQGSFALPMEVLTFLFGVPLLVALVGAASSVYVAGRERQRERALLRAAGATSPALVAGAVFEAVILVGTSTLLGCAAVVAGAWVVHLAAGDTVLTIDVMPLVVLAGGGLALMLLATLVPLVELRPVSVARVLAAE